MIKLTQNITALCNRLQATLDQMNFAQRRQLVELLIDCVIVSDEQVEIRYVIPIGPQGETTSFIMCDQTMYTRFARWCDQRVWERMLAHFANDPDMEHGILDSIASCYRWILVSYDSLERHGLS